MPHPCRFLLPASLAPKAATRPPGQSASSGFSSSCSSGGMCTTTSHHQAESRLSAAQVIDTRDAHKCASAQPLCSRASRAISRVGLQLRPSRRSCRRHVRRKCCYRLGELAKRPRGRPSSSPDEFHDLIRSALDGDGDAPRGWDGSSHPSPHQ